MSLEGIASTSLLTAAMRAAESRRSESEGRLFVDPYAELLAGKEGELLLQRALVESGDQPAIAIRTKFIDDRFLSAMNQGIRQIVILATGMDTRAYRLDFHADTHIFELDRKEVIDYKTEKLKTIQPRCHLTSLNVDLREEWQKQLLQAGFKQNERTLWLVEGLLMYLEEEQVITLFKKINSLAIEKDIMLFDILSRTLLEVPHMEKQLKFLASLNAPWKFGINDPVNFMKKLNWDASLSQAGDVAPNRWPFPTAPLSIPNIPRGYYVEAIKLK